MVVTVALCGCVEDRPARGDADGLEIVDLSRETGFTEQALGHYKRGRTCAPGDFDGDGALDLFIGSPQDPAVLMRGVVDDDGVRFEAKVLSGYGRTYWAAGALDLDGDGDTDVFAGLGGNETEELDLIYRNVHGELVEEEPGVPLAGPAGLQGEATPTATAGVRWGDLDLDGDLDLFLSTNLLDLRDANLPGDLLPTGRDRLLLNDGAGVFTEVGFDAGLTERDPSFNSTLFDFDNDGDLDIYQNTLVGLNRLWRNHIAETGALFFTDDTRAVSPDGEVRMVDPVVKAFSTASADLNNDGWEDLIVWHRGPTQKSHAMDRHLVWLNLGGTRFVEVGDRIGIAERWHDCEDYGRGVMGSQVGDLDLDGFPDLFIGNGSPDGGCANQLWLSDGLEPMDVPRWGTVMVPRYRDASEWIDFPAEGADEVPFPYRTHGACIADYDADGRPELAFVNGGPGWAEDWVREPNRYFDVQSDRHFLAIRPVGDGIAVAEDAIGTHVMVRVWRERDGAEWEVHQRLYGGNGFAAHNGPELLLGLADADRILDLELTWPDGRVDELEPPELDQRVTVRRKTR